MEPLPVVEKSQANCALIRGWASPYGAVVRQPTAVYQETTVAKHGTQHFSLAHGPSSEKLLASTIERLLYWGDSLYKIPCDLLLSVCTRRRC